MRHATEPVGQVKRVIRFIRLAAFPVVALLTGGSAPQPAPLPFDGTWMSCQTYRGARFCAYKALVQRGTRVCGVQGDFATNRYYVQRFVATAAGRQARIDRICGDPGSETDTYCAGQAPSDGAKVGWGTSERSLYRCGDRLKEGRTGAPFSCAKTAGDALPKVRHLSGDGAEPGDQAWMKACLDGVES